MRRRGFGPRAEFIANCQVPGCHVVRGGVKLSSPAARYCKSPKATGGQEARVETAGSARFGPISVSNRPPLKWSTPELWFFALEEDPMPRKIYKPEEIVAKLRQVEVLTSQGQGVADAIRSIGVSEVTYYRWRQEFGGLKSDQVKRLKDLETENTRLRRAVSDLTLDKLILQEAARGNY